MTLVGSSDRQERGEGGNGVLSLYSGGGGRMSLAMLSTNASVTGENAGADAKVT